MKCPRMTRKNQKRCKVWVEMGCPSVWPGDCSNLLTKEGGLIDMTVEQRWRFLLMVLEIIKHRIERWESRQHEDRRIKRTRKEVA